jgi:hypothetical protein
MTPFFALLDVGDFAIIFGIVFCVTAIYSKSVNSRRLEMKLDALLKHQGIILPPLSDEVQRLARDPAKKVAAIQLHRHQTGLGLAKAKADIEEFIKTGR